MVNDNDDSRRMIEQCYKRKKTTVNPIIDWTDADVWQFIRSENISYCGLYDEGFTRLGCVGCPMAGKHRWKEFNRFPTYKNAYVRAFDKMIEARRDHGKPIQWADGEEAFKWWMEDSNINGQISFDDLDEEI